MEEIAAESGYSFTNLLENGDVRWRDAVRPIGEWGPEDKSFYRNLCPEEGYSFLVWCNPKSDIGKWEIYLFQEGWLSEPYQELYSKEINGRIDFADYNFDGYTDLAIGRGREIYLWDAEEKKYQRVALPEDFLTDDTALFPETETIWSYGAQLFQSAENDGSCTDYRIESLWQWEGGTLVRRRECREETRGDTVQLRIYDDMLAEYLQNRSFTKEEQWQEETVSLYECFYEGLAPQSTYERRHYATRGTASAVAEEYIPQGLVDKITEAILSGTELEILTEMMNARVLTDEEITALARENMDLRLALNDMYAVGNYVMVLADGDNDGIEDIISEEYYGGTGGFTDYVFYKGNADGSYQRTDSIGSVREEFGIIDYEGKNYLCRTCYDYTKKIYNGIGLICYVDGSMVETVDLTLTAESYDVRPAECADEKYRPLAARIEADCLTYKEVIDEYQCIEGSAEEALSEEEEWAYQCDLDNDGVAEQYDKSIWTPSNISTREWISFDWNDGSYDLWNEIFDIDGSPIMLWADAYGEENVVNVIYLTGLDDFEIRGFVIQGSEYQSVYRIAADAVYGVEEIRSCEESDPSKG
ncbi:MAG: hypothetical protein NC337_05250 [Roseburia sp.]|nr:hypothetical protein [Roseburia sp.]